MKQQDKYRQSDDIYMSCGSWLLIGMFIAIIVAAELIRLGG